MIFSHNLEVFDVNGIEDFYDKNAMITYEVNGHEIPVHMKPKYTPQSKSMFPEYMKESSATIGMTRQTREKNLQRQRLSEKPDNRPSTFTGLSEKDMPEYTVHESPDVSNARLQQTNQKSKEISQFAGSELAKLKMQESTKNSPLLVEQVSSQQPANQQPHNDNNSSNELLKVPATEAFSKLPSTAPNIQLSLPDTFAEHLTEKQLAEMRISDLVQTIAKLKSRQKQIESAETPSLDVNPQTLARINEEKKITPETIAITTSQSAIQNPEVFKEVSKFIGNHVMKPSNSVPNLPSSFPKIETSQTEEISKSFTKSSSEAPESLQKVEMPEPRPAPEQSNTPITSEQENKNEENNIEPEKAKAKEKILNLLGELTNKLKGMEAAVTGSQNSEAQSTSKEEQEKGQVKVQTENPAQTENKVSVNPEEIPQPKTSFAMGTSADNIPHDITAKLLSSSDSAKSEFAKFHENSTSLSGFANLGLPNPGMSNLDISRLALSNIDQTKSDFPEVKNSFTRYEEESIPDIESKKKKKEEMEFYQQAVHPHPYVYENVKQGSLYIKPAVTEPPPLPKNLPEILAKYKAQNKPFVMNTDAIDYKPEPTMVDDDIETNPTVRHAKAKVSEKQDKNDFISSAERSNKDLDWDSKRLSQIVPDEALKSFLKEKKYPKLIDEKEDEDILDDESLTHSLMHNEDNDRSYKYYHKSQKKMKDIVNNNNNKENEESNTYEVEDNDKISEDRDNVARRKTFHPKMGMFGFTYFLLISLKN